MEEVFEINSKAQTPTVWTIGHSTRELDDFIQLLRSSEIVNLVDVRSYPGSHRYPQFNRAELRQALASSGIEYYHSAKLGGRRKPSPQSKNTAWHNISFRAYADHMESAEFEEGVDELLKLAGARRTSIMCAEAVWWRCHRGLIADYLKALGAEVIHIVNGSRLEPHPYTAAARILDGRLSYGGLLQE